MTTDTITNPGSSTSLGPKAEFLNALHAIATEEVSPLERAEQLLNEARWKKVMSMTPTRFARLSPVERRNYARWAAHFRDVFAEKARLFGRNTTAEPELPADLRARGSL